MTPRNGSLASAASSANVITPRGKQDTNVTVQLDNAVFKSAMQATLSTPRGPAASASADAIDTPMAGAVNKMFKGGLQHV